MKPFFFDKHNLAEISRNNSRQYGEADPCPHGYFDNVLPQDVADLLLKEFPKPDSEIWKNKYKDEHQYKMACEDPSKFPQGIRNVLGQFNSAVFLEFLEELTGINGLIPDPYYRGGGMHQIIPGGFLKVHVDFNWHKKMKLERRLNVIFFLNKDWKDEYGGHFELWDKDMKESKVKVLPVFNRMAIFSTSENSFHGHPDPLKCPPGMSRKSLALYYYTSPATGSQSEAKDSHSTIFKSRPGEVFKKENSVRSIFIQFIPPILLKVLKRLRW